MTKVEPLFYCIGELKDCNIVNGFLKTDFNIILRTPYQNITQEFTVIIHPDTKLDLEPEDIKDTDGSVTSAITNLKI